MSPCVVGRRGRRRRTAGAEVWESGAWPTFVVRREATMAGKDKGGRSSKTPAAKTAKEKRKSKQAKKAAKDNTALLH